MTTPTLAATTPLYLSGCVVEGALDGAADGWMLTPQMGNNPDLATTPWAADNGCFARPDLFDGPKYLGWLGRKPLRSNLFATAPDRVGDAEETIRLSAPYLYDIRRMGYRAAFIGQDGLEFLHVPWEEFDAYFVGGSTTWKLGSASEALAREAKRRGKWVHVGRVNSYRRYHALRTWGCVDSVDGTFLAFGPRKNIPRLAAWKEAARCQGVLPA